MKAQNFVMKQRGKRTSLSTITARAIQNMSPDASAL